MNWQGFRYITASQVGAFLALMLVALMPHFGMRLPSALLVLIGGWVIWSQHNRFRAQVDVRRLAIIFSLLLVPIVLSIPNSLVRNQSANVAMAVFFYFFAGLALVYGLRDTAHRLWLAKWLTTVMVVWMADGMIQFFFGRDLLGYPLTPDGRLTGPFHGNLSLSTTLAILLPIAVWYLLRKGSLAVLLIIVGAGVIAALVGTRNALLMMVIVGVGTALRMTRRVWPAFALVALVVISAISLSPGMQNRIERFSSKDDAGTFEYFDRILSGRLTLWETGIRMVNDQPLTGVGAGVFSNAYDLYSTRADDPFHSSGSRGSPFHAHNIYLSIAAETGLIGLLGIIIAFLLCVRWYYAAPPQKREEAWPYAFALLIAMFPFSIEYTIYKLWFFPIPLLLLCAMLAALSNANGGIIKSTWRQP